MATYKIGVKHERQRIMEAIALEIIDAKEIEKKNKGVRMPRLEGYMEALQFCLSKAKFDDASKDKAEVKG